MCVRRDARLPAAGSTSRCPHRALRPARGAARGRGASLAGFAVSRARGLPRRCGWAGSWTCSRAPTTRTRATRCCGVVLDGFRARGRGPRAGLRHERAAGRRPAARAASCSGRSPMQFCVRARVADGAVLQRPRRAGTWCSATATWTDEHAAGRARRHRHRGRRPVVGAGARRRMRGAQRGAPARAAGALRPLRRAARPTWSPGRWPRGESSAAVLRALRARAAAARSARTSTRGPRRPSAPRTSRDHTYPHNLPPELLERQLERADGRRSERAWACGPRPTAPAATASTAARCRSWSGSATRSTPASTRSSTSGASAAWCFAGAPARALPPDYEDVRRPGRSRILEIPITAATLPGLPKPLEALYTRLPPLPWRGALKRLGLRAVWLRPSYSPLRDMLAFADRAARRGGAACFNIIFHSSELLPGGSPYTPDAPSVERFLDDLSRLLEHLTARLGAVGPHLRASSRGDVARARAPAHEGPHGHAAPAAAPGGQRAAAAPAGRRRCAAAGTRCAS